MRTAENTYYIPKGKASSVKSKGIANAMAAELLNYGVVVDTDLMNRISSQPEKAALDFSKEIVKEYSVGALNAPLFPEWEKRTFFALDEFIIQIFGYVFQFSGNDLYDAEYLPKLLSKIEVGKFKKLNLTAEKEAVIFAEKLFQAKVSQDRKSLLKIKAAVKYFADILPKLKIHSDEVRVAALAEFGDLKNGLKQLNCKPVDVLRLFGSKVNPDYVKLPCDIKYAGLKWKERVAALEFWNSHDFETLSESMGVNRSAWLRFFRHCHLFGQKDFIKKYPNVVFAAMVSVGQRWDQLDKKFQSLKNDLVEITDGGAMAYRTFASRITGAIDKKDFKAIKILLDKKGGYLFRNLLSISNAIAKKDQQDFLNFCRSKLPKIGADVMFSILSIDVGAAWRIIDAKGDTTVQAANYPAFITELQNDIRVELKARYGVKGKINVTKDLEGEIVPFLSKNTNLGRGTEIDCVDTKYIYFFTHWVQKNLRTDLDLSFIAFDEDWNSSVVAFYNQANSYLNHSGDITNAPAPNGATEYGRISLREIPRKIRYIAPVINVYSGDNFSQQSECYAGFSFSDKDTFQIQANDNHRYDLNQPAKANIPFVLDIREGKVMTLDFNKRLSMGSIAADYISDIIKVIKASKTKNYITIEKFAEILSGDDKKISLTIAKSGNGKDEIGVDELFSLVS